jgi:XTP/dITP diphosphohydrolase
VHSTRLVLATHNKDKVVEIGRILAGLDVEITTLDDYPDAPEPVEDGTTLEENASLEENALKKAREIRDFTGRSALADDTGLFVDALDGAPGVSTRSTAHPACTPRDSLRRKARETRGTSRTTRNCSRP